LKRVQHTESWSWVLYSIGFPLNELTGNPVKTA
jgi:hypothetical protein